MTVRHPDTWRAPARQATPPGALPHYRGPFTCEMVGSILMRDGTPPPPQMFAALLAKSPDPDGYNYAEIEGSWPRQPVRIVARSATHLAISHPLVFEVGPQDVPSLGLFDEPDPGSGRLWCYGALRSSSVADRPEDRFEFPAFGVLIKRPFNGANLLL